MVTQLALPLPSMKTQFWPYEIIQVKLFLFHHSAIVWQQNTHKYM